MIGISNHGIARSQLDGEDILAAFLRVPNISRPLLNVSAINHWQNRSTPLFRRWRRQNFIFEIWYVISQTINVLQAIFSDA